MPDHTQELREALGVTAELLASYDPARAVSKLGRMWAYETISGTAAPGGYPTRKEAMAAAKRHLALKREQYENPSAYYSIEAVRADQRLAVADEFRSRGYTELEAWGEARKVVPYAT